MYLLHLHQTPIGSVLGLLATCLRFQLQEGLGPFGRLTLEIEAGVGGWEMAVERGLGVEGCCVSLFRDPLCPRVSGS